MIKITTKDGRTAYLSLVDVILILQETADSDSYLLHLVNNVILPITEETAGQLIDMCSYEPELDEDTSPNWDEE